MDPNKEIENIDEVADDAEQDDSVSVDDFIKQLEAKEKDLHITADTTIIEIAEGFEDGELSEFMTPALERPVESVKPLTAAAAPAKAKESKGTTAKLEKEIGVLKDTIAQMKTERDELLQLSQRRSKDFENFKTRTERERKETFQSLVGNLATQMLPALDNLNRALDFALAMPEEKRIEIQQFLDGIVLVNQQVNDVLAEMGVQPIATVGEVFDPHYHEAVATEESSEFEPNTISAELLRGYRIGDRVIRHSMVKVAKQIAAESFVTEEPVASDAESEDVSHDAHDGETPDAE